MANQNKARNHSLSRSSRNRAKGKHDRQRAATEANKRERRAKHIERQPGDLAAKARGLSFERGKGK